MVHSGRTASGAEETGGQWTEDGICVVVWGSEFPCLLSLACSPWKPRNVVGRVWPQYNTAKPRRVSLEEFGAESG